jgi:RNA polymerase-binding transcription factor DksA
MDRPLHPSSSDPAAGAVQGDMDLDAAAERLHNEREEVRDRLASMTTDLEYLVAASVNSNADDEHDPEGQTIAFERSQLSALIQSAQAHLARIDGAVLRLQQGSYGICDVCGMPLPAARLEARPAAQTCVQHAASR